MNDEDRFVDIRLIKNVDGSSIPISNAVLDRLTMTIFYNGITCECAKELGYTWEVEE